MYKRNKHFLNMKTIGFNFTKNDFRYSVLEGDIENPGFVSRERIVYPEYETPELMEWLETQLNLIIDKYNPNKVGYRIDLPFRGFDVSQIKGTYYAQAILNLSCCKKRIVVTSFHYNAIINGKKLGLTKGANLSKYVDDKLGLHAPYWDKSTKCAVLIAWKLL